MSNVRRLKSLQGLILGDYKEPKFIPTSRDVQAERVRQFAAQKLLNGWDAKDVIYYLVHFNGYTEDRARKVVVPLYNRLVTPIKEQRGF